MAYQLLAIPAYQQKPSHGPDLHHDSPIKASGTVDEYRCLMIWQEHNANIHPVWIEIDGIGGQKLGR